MLRARHSTLSWNIHESASPSTSQKPYKSYISLFKIQNLNLRSRLFLFKILLCQCWSRPSVAGRNLILCSRELGIPGLIENLKTLQTKCLFNMVWNQGKYSSLKALSIRILLLLSFAFFGLTLENVWLFSLFFTYSTEWYQALQSRWNDIYCALLSDCHLSFAFELQQPSTDGDQSRKLWIAWLWFILLLLFTFLFVFHSLCPSWLI